MQSAITAQRIVPRCWAAETELALRGAEPRELRIESLRSHQPSTDDLRRGPRNRGHLALGFNQRTRRSSTRGSPVSCTNRENENEQLNTGQCIAHFRSAQPKILCVFTREQIRHAIAAQNVIRTSLPFATVR
jgi:hypothetical protein